MKKRYDAPTMKTSRAQRVMSRQQGESFRLHSDAHGLPSHHAGGQQQLRVNDLIAIAPLPSGEYDGEKVIARTDQNYEQLRPSRDEVRRANYERRREQLSRQGFHSASTRPYRELGEVELNERRLLLKAVGQDQRVRLDSLSSGVDEPVNWSQFSSSSTIGLKIQANKADLKKLTLEEQLSTASQRLFDVKQGRGLFKLIKQEEEHRLQRRQQAAQEEARQLRATWRPADAMDDASRPSGFHSTTSLRKLSITSDDGLGISRSSSRSPGAERARSGGRASQAGSEVTSASALESAHTMLGSAVHASSLGIDRTSQNLDGLAAGGSTARITPFHAADDPATRDSSSRTSLLASDSGTTENHGSETTLGRERSLHQAELVDIPEDLEEEENYFDTSSTRLHSMSHSSLASSGGEDDTIDMEFTLRFLSVIKWILEGMLIENLATLPPVIYSWSPAKELETQRARVAFLEMQRHADEKWDKMVTTPVGHLGTADKTRSGTWHPGQRIIRYPKNKAPTIHHSTASHYMPESPASSSDINTPNESPMLHVPAKTDMRIKTPTQAGVRKSPSPTAQASPVPVQRKLSPEQMEWFLGHINNQTHHFHRRRPRSSIGYKQKSDEDELETRIPYTPEANVTLDPARMRQRFANAAMRKQLIVQTQLMAMERDRYQTCTQKFEALSRLPANGRLWSDMEQVRAGVETETAAMARRKLLMNYEWFRELKNRLPDSVHEDQRCGPVIQKLSKLHRTYVQVGPRKLNKAKLMKVLTCLRPWELEVPEVQQAIEFVRKDIVYLSDKEFANWKRRTLQSRPARVIFRRTVTFPGYV